jgi:hypothetical protein
MSPVGFEPATPSSERPQTHALDRVATGIGKIAINMPNVKSPRETNRHINTKLANKAQN